MQRQLEKRLLICQNLLLEYADLCNFDKNSIEFNNLEYFKD